MVAGLSCLMYQEVNRLFKILTIKTNNINKKTTKVLPEPFLKWAGGKRQLLPELLARVELAAPFNNYHEPFVGGGALFFALYCRGHLADRSKTNTSIYLSDTNERIIEAYIGLRDFPEYVIAILRRHKHQHCKEYYYSIRAEVPDTLPERAARIIYLNRTCFNGLYRENSRGEFNVPMGSYVNPRICDEENHRAVAKTLQSVTLSSNPFEKILDVAKPDDFVYFDPPYHPISKTSSFTGYNKDSFNELDQCRLADTFKTLTERGVKVLLSNSMTSLIQELYGAFTFDTVQADRKVNSKADGRGKIAEALVRNF